MAEGVRGDVLVEAGAFGGAADDEAEDRRLEPSAFKAAEHAALAGRRSASPQTRELAGERRGERLAARLAALAAADKQRGALGFEVEVAPVQREQLGAAKTGRDERQEDEPVALDKPGRCSARLPAQRRAVARTLRGEPVGLWWGLPGGSRSRNGSGTPARAVNQR